MEASLLDTISFWFKICIYIRQTKTMNVTPFQWPWFPCIIWIRTFTLVNNAADLSPVKNKIYFKQNSLENGVENKVRADFLIIFTISPDFEGQKATLPNQSIKHSNSLSIFILWTDIFWKYVQINMNFQSHKRNNILHKNYHNCIKEKLFPYCCFIWIWKYAFHVKWNVFWLGLIYRKFVD